jgi:hypothetical protein
MVEAGHKRSFRMYINLIRRDAPVFQKDSDGKFVRDSQNRFIPTGETEQAVFYWETGIQNAEALAEKDALYHGLMSRDFTITRKGSGLDTRYLIEPADPDGGPVPLTEADQALEADKPDLNKFTVPRSREELIQILNGVDPWVLDNQPQKVPPPVTSAAAETENPFERKR